MSDNQISSLKFSIPIKLVSINNTYYADKRHGMKPDAKEMQYKVFHTIMQSETQSQFETLRSQFDVRKHGFSVKIVSHLLGFYNKQGLPSSHICDLSNTEKLLIDSLFLPKFYGDNVPYQAKNLNIDDKYLIELYSSKKPSNTKNYVEIEISLVSLPK